MSNLNKFGITEAQMLVLANQHTIQYRFGNDSMADLLKYSQALLALAAPSVASGAQDRQTDLSKKLRAKANQPFGPEDFALLTAAAEEIERYYTGMLNWKASAEARDVAIAAQAKPSVTDLSGQQCHKILQEMAVDAMKWDETYGDREPTEEEISKRAVEFIMNRVLANSAPNKALVEALQAMVRDFEGCYADAESAMIKARAALKAAGVEIE